MIELSLRATGYQGACPRTGQLFKRQEKPAPLSGVH